MWHVIRSKPNREDFLARELESRSVEVYFPRLRAHPVNPRARRFKPYFPGYLFIHVDLEQINPSAFERVPGAANLVSFGGEISSIPDNMVHAIRCKVDEINATGGEKTENWHPGDVVEIDQGPFAGYPPSLMPRCRGVNECGFCCACWKNGNFRWRCPLRIFMPAANVETPAA
jgi:transcriptional antiterminator RfaH